MTFYYPSPSSMIHKINYIYYKADSTGKRTTPENQMTLAIEEQKQKIRQEEFGILKKIKNIPLGYLRQNDNKRVGYKIIEKMEVE